ncbi:MAG: hypothetical protein ABR999_11195 [Methanoregula sp.]|jgi:hypothetical protein|uniref:hypothetical protein n=1 Tax=Methanoregula sp. TaxID=2052170 RepID=UPI003D1024A2
MNTVLALDPGFGNAKVCIDGHVAVMQSVIARPQSVGMAAIGGGIASQVTLIEWGLLGQERTRGRYAPGSVDAAQLGCKGS